MGLTVNVTETKMEFIRNPCCKCGVFGLNQRMNGSSVQLNWEELN